MRDKKIVVAGLICLDLTPQFPAVRTADFYEMLQPGKTVNTKGITISGGGAVSNTGLGLAKLGGNAHVMAKLGNDFFGELLKRELQGYSVEATLRYTDEAATSYSVVVAIPGYDRLFIHDTGSNTVFSWEELDYGVIEEAEIFHFGYPQNMKCFYRNNGSELIKMYQKVKELGTATSLDMAVADMRGEAGQVDWKMTVKQVTPYVDIFVPSVEELSYAIDPEGFREISKKAAEQKKSFEEIVSLEYVRKLASTLLAWGGKIVLIKCGVQGMFLKTASREVLETVGGTLAERLEHWGSKEIYIPCYEPDCVRSGSGAGDVSIAAFLLALQRAYPVRRCVELAAAAGATCVASYDAYREIPALEELNEKLERGWKQSSRRMKEIEK